MFTKKYNKNLIMLSSRYDEKKDKLKRLQQKLVEKREQKGN